MDRVRDRREEAKQIVMSFAQELAMIDDSEVGVISIDPESALLSKCSRSEIVDLLPLGVASSEFTQRLHAPNTSVPGYQEVLVVVLFVRDIDDDWDGANLETAAAMTIALVRRGVGPRGVA